MPEAFIARELGRRASSPHTRAGAPDSHAEQALFEVFDEDHLVAVFVIDNLVY